MQTDRLDNCRFCGRLFLKDHTDYCLDCYKKIEQELGVVSNFLKDEKNRNATMEEVSEFTGVSSVRITEFIRDGRIYTEAYPNLGYPCAHCGIRVKRQMLCDDCFKQFTSEVDRALKIEKFSEEVSRNKQTRTKTSQYWKARD